MTQNYATNPAVGIAGMIVDTSLKDLTSAVVETAAVAFGLAVGRGSAADTVKLSGAAYVGVAVLDKAQPAEDTTVDAYDVGRVAGVARKGTIWVEADGAVVVDDDATYTEATGRIGTAAVAAGIVSIPNGKFLDAGSDGDLVRLYLA